MEDTRAARVAADAAARRAGVSIDELTGTDELAALSDVIDAVWHRATPMIEFGLLVAIGHAGGYVVGASESSGMIGGAVAFVGLQDGTPVLHSHVVGFVDGSRGGGRGRALKLHQRAWALEHGIDVVEWTFDPLVRRNGWFNLQSLGAGIRAYVENCYGSLRDDGINGADESDRLVARWELRSERARRAAEATLAPPPVDRDTDTCPTPEDIVALRRRDPDAAARWRVTVRAALAPRLAAGATITGMTPAGDYALTPMTSPP